MAKKLIIKPFVSMLPDVPTNTAAAADSLWATLTPTSAGFSLEDSAEEVEVTTSEDEGFRSYLAGLRDFTATLMFRGGDNAADYAEMLKAVRKTSYFILALNKDLAISAENPAWAFLGQIFTLPYGAEIGQASPLDVTIRPAGGGGIEYVTAAATITGTYTNAVLPTVPS